MALVLLHPLPLDGESWPDEIRRLGADIVAPTLYCLGDSIEQWAAAAVDLAGPGRHTILGNSVGGSCAIEVARLAPDRVERLILVGTKAGHRPEPTFRDEAIRLLTDEGLDTAWERYWAPLFGPDAPPRIVEAARRRCLAQGVDDIVRGVVAFHSRVARDEFLAGWDGPVDVVAGEHDRAPHARRSAELAATMPHGTFHLIAGAGHYVPFEAPGQLSQIIAEPPSIV